MRSKSFRFFKLYFASSNGYSNKLNQEKKRSLFRKETVGPISNAPLLSTKLALSCMCFCMAASFTKAWQPSGKVDCIAPAKPGGGWDFTCRSVGKTLEDLHFVPKSVQTINMPGADGGVAFAHVVSKRDDDDNLLVAASTALTTRLAQNKSETSNATKVKWVGAIGADYGVIAVANDSKYQNLNELMLAMKEDPRAVTFSGGSIRGGWDHLKLLMAAKAVGVRNLPNIPYLTYNSGGEAIVQLMGGHVDAVTGDISEATAFWASGDIRILAVLSEERLPGKLSSIPTAVEQGIDVIGPNWRGFYMPKQADTAAQDYWVNAIDKLYASPEWKEIMSANGLIAFHPDADQFEAFIYKQIADIEAISREIGLID